MHVLIMTVVLLTICVGITSRALQGRTLQSRSVARDEALTEMDAVAARLWACLDDARYPAYGACSPSTVQRACVPAGAAVTFDGTYPDCHIRLAAEK